MSRFWTATNLVIVFGGDKWYESKDDNSANLVSVLHPRMIDWGFVYEDELSTFSSLVKDFKDLKKQVVSSIHDEEHIMQVKDTWTQVLPNKMQQCQLIKVLAFLPESSNECIDKLRWI